MHTYEPDVVLPHHVKMLVKAILQANPPYFYGINEALVKLNPDEIKPLENYLSSYINQGLSIDYFATCYLTVMADVLRETMYFQENRKYRYSSFSEVADNVYFNDLYMSLYMHGVFITLFFWPNHIELFRFFRSTLPKNKRGCYLEIGPGHGYFLKTAVDLTEYNHFVGIDLSETSIRQTQKLAGQHHGKKIDLHCVDFLQCPLKASHFDAIVMGEMLEHVEKPLDFIRKIALIATKNAYIFITTCINAPMTDHIYLFKNTKQLEDLFSEGGLRIKHQCILPYVGKTLEECVDRFLAINVGYVLEKK